MSIRNFKKWFEKNKKNWAKNELINYSKEHSYLKIKNLALIKYTLKTLKIYRFFWYFLEDKIKSRSINLSQDNLFFNFQ